MKLKNKKTGEIGFVYTGLNGEVKVCSEHDENHTCLGQYSSLSELNEEWDDYEEPKTEFYITGWGDIREYTTEEERFAFKQKLEIGNYFSSREEAEKAVEKLKAWKRLKDKGYRVMMNNHVDGMLYLRIWNDTTDAPTPINKAGEIYKDLDLLFGGEE